MIRNIILLSVLLAPAFGNSMGWPVKKELPDSISVGIDVPPTWGSKSAVDDHSAFRVTISNKRNSDLQLLNISFSEPRFVLVKGDGSEVHLDIPVKNLSEPNYNPGITLGPLSQSGFKIEMDRPVRPADLKEGTIVLDVKISFVAGDIVEGEDRRGYLEGFNYTMICRMSGAERLLK